MRRCSAAGDRAAALTISNHTHAGTRMSSPSCAKVFLVTEEAGAALE